MLSDRRRCQTEQNGNPFWRLLGAVLGEPMLHALSYDARLVCVPSHGIGIRDVLDACHRLGSLDSAIRKARPNDFDSLREHAPRLKRVCVNGKTAGRFADVIGQAGYETLVLPSSSPAKAMPSFERGLEFRRRRPMPVRHDRHSSSPHRHRGFSPLSQHTAISSATHTAMQTAYASGERCGGTRHAVAMMPAANSSSTTQPCHATGKPHPQP
uniref:Uncharacterized protein n=1 Tax=Burkholderia cenocepacia TaxID=95486 RepID=A0A071M575_9BURK